MLSTGHYTLVLHTLVLTWEEIMSSIRAFALLCLVGLAVFSVNAPAFAAGKADLVNSIFAP